MMLISIILTKTICLHENNVTAENSSILAAYLTART